MSKWKNQCAKWVSYANLYLFLFDVKNLLETVRSMLRNPVLYSKAQRKSMECIQDVFLSTLSKSIEGMCEMHPLVWCNTIGVT